MLKGKANPNCQLNADCAISLCIFPYISAFLHQSRQPLHKVCDKNDVHDICEVRRLAREGHQLLAQRLSIGGVDSYLEREELLKKKKNSPGEQEFQKSVIKHTDTSKMNFCHSLPFGEFDYCTGVTSIYFF